MSHQSDGRRRAPAAARVFGDLQADDALNPGGVSALRRTSALFLTLLFVAATPLFFAAFATGVIGDPPAALAKSGSTLSDDDDSSGPGSGDDDDDDTGTHTGAGAQAATDDTSANGASTRGTTNDNDTKTKLGTDDTSANAVSTRGTTNDNDTGTHDSGQTQTNTGTNDGTVDGTTTGTGTGS